MTRKLAKGLAMIVTFCMFATLLSPLALAAEDGVTMYINSAAVYENDTPPERAEGAVYKSVADAAAKVTTYKDIVYIQDTQWTIEEDFTLEKPAATFKLRIPEENTLTIDLKGNSYSLNNISLINDGTLIITDSVGDGEFVSNANPAVDNYGSLTIDGAKITSTKSMGVKAEGGSSVVMESGELTGTTYALYTTGKNANLEIKAGVFNGTVDGRAAGTMTIGVKDAEDDTFLINGTNNKLAVNSSPVVYCGDVPNLTGSFTADAVINCKIRKDVSSILPAGMECKAYTDEKGTYYKIETLTSENSAASVTKPDDSVQYYSSAVAAFSAAQEGDTITLNKDSEENLRTTVSGITIDLGGNRAASIVINADGKEQMVPVTVTHGTVDSLTAGTNDSSYTMELIVGDDLNIGSLSLSSAYVAYTETILEKMATPAFGSTNAQGQIYLYSSVAGAIRNSADQTAYLMKDYTGSETLGVNASGTLDLMEHVYTSSSTHVLYPTGTNQQLTVKNGTLASSRENDSSIALVEILSSSISLTLEDVNLKGSEGFGIVTNGTYSNIQITLDSTTLTMDGGMGIYFPSKDSTLTIEDSQITAGTGVGIKGGTVTVKGNTVIRGIGEKVVPDAGTSSGIADTGDAIYVEGNYGFPTTVNIESGTFTSDNGYAVQMLFAEPEDIGEVYDINISGGSFSTKPDDAYLQLPPGNALIEQPDGTWATAPDVEAVVSIGDKGYLSLDAALTEAVDGDTITILKDITLETTPVAIDKNLTIIGQNKEDGTKVTVSGAKGLFSFAATKAAGKTLTLQNLKLTAIEDGQWYIYHSAGTLVIDGCDFTMAENVTHTGNIIMGEGNSAQDASYRLQFVNNTITANARAALVGIGNGSVIQNNTIDLLSERYNQSDERTSILALTADENGTVTITNNTFKNANRALAVDNSAIKGENLNYQNNKFYDVRYAFELSSEKNAEQSFDVSHNYFEFDGEVAAAKIQDADSDGDTFSYGDSSVEYQPASEEESIVSNEPYYGKETMLPEDLVTSTPEPTATPTAAPTTEPTTEPTTAPTRRPNVSSGSAATRVFVITATAGEGGSISPSGEVNVERFHDQRFNMTPDAGYAVKDVVVDGESVGAVTSYTFENVRMHHTIAVTFTEAEAEPTPTPTPTTASLPFVDVRTSDWYYDAVTYTFENEMMNGTSATTFEPNNMLTRGMVVQILYNLEGRPAVGTGQFVDVVPGQWYTDAVNWGAANGIVNGYGDGIFGPERNVTREELVAFLYRYASLKGRMTAASGNVLYEFSDYTSISAGMEDAMRWAVAEGVLHGYTDGTLQPSGYATRAEAAQMMMNFSESILK